MNNKRPKYLISTDSIGMLGKPEQFIDIYKDYFIDGTLDGVEMIAFKSITRLKKFISLLKENNIPTVSFHGKTGGEERLNFFSRIVMTLLNASIEDVDKLIENFPGIEFLSHAPYFEQKSTRETIFNQKPKKIWIENQSVGKEGIEENIKQIILYRKNGINALGIFDVYHYVSRLDQGKILEDWVEIVNQIESYFKMKDQNGKQFFSGIHFPVGSRPDDSLPIDRMTDQMLELFAKKIIPYIDRLVIENQQKLPGLFFITEKMLREQKLRNKRIFKRLRKTGIVY
jgi:hypothetical protein